MKISAPLRLDLCGGVTDIPEIATEVGTVITNVGVRVYDDPDHLVERTIEVEITPSATRHTLTVNEVEVPLDTVSDTFELFRRTAAHLLEQTQGDTGPLHLALSNTLPRGTGLGGSAVASSCLFGSVDAWLRQGQLSDPDTLIRKAHTFETTTMGIAGGFQDYIGAYFGGANFIDFTGLAGAQLGRNSQLGMGVTEELRELIDNSMVLAVATAHNQSSSDIVEDEVQRFRGNPNAYLEGLNTMRKHNRLLAAMVCGKLATNPTILGAIMQETWSIQKTLSPMVGSLLTDVEDRAMSYVHGLHGPGAGGNSLALLAKPGAKADLIDMLTQVPDVAILYPQVSQGIEIRA